MSPMLYLAQCGVLLTCAASVGTLVYVMLVQPLLAAPVHGLRGLKRARARNAVSQFKSFEPLMRWLAARLSPLLSGATQDKLAQKITIAGEVWGLWPAELRALSLLCGGLAGVSAAGCMLLADMQGLIVPLGFCVGAATPDMQLGSTARKRVRSISRRIPHIVDLLVLALGAGLDFPAALRQVVERSADPESDVIEELGLVLEELKLGSTRRYALEQLARRAPCDEVRDLVAAAVQSEEQGTPLGVVLGTQATTSRQRRSTRAEETASKASTAMVLPLVLLFVALIVLMIGPVAFDALRSQNSLGGI
jgi:tight adherence protein C